VAVSVIAAPFLPPLRLLASVARRILPPQTGFPVREAFLAGDFAASHELVEMLVASALMALAAGVQLLIALEFLSLPLASLLTFIFAFATPVWSTASRALWNHTPALLMLSCALYLLILGRRQSRLAAYASIPLALAFMTRPTMAIPAVVLTIYVAFHHRRELPRFILLAAPFAVAFFSYNEVTRHQLFQSYFTDTGVWPPATWPARFGLQLISPSRGLFVFSPILLFSLAGLFLAWRRRWLYPLVPWLAFLMGAQVLLVARYYWPGYCYGPRYFTEFVPLFTLFLIPVLQSRLSVLALVLFAITLGWSVFVHARGATSFAVHRWNGTPTDIDHDTARAWDWRDPQFLR
jgi:hypothetical protein